RCLGAAERYVVIEAGCRQVYHDEAGLCVGLKMSGVLTRGRADSRGQTVNGVVCYCQSLIVIPHSNDGGNGAENFIAVDLHLICRLDEKRRRNVIPRRVAL